MVDEIDTLQSDSVYRESLENVIDYYFMFKRRWRCAVSATLKDFTNPDLFKQNYVTLIQEKTPRRNIRLSYTNYVDDLAIYYIKLLCRASNEKILIAYNTIDGILNIFQQLGENLKSECGILCSERSYEKIDEYNIERNNVIDKQGRLHKRIVFMTCAYFAGIDINDRCHLISITSYRQPFSYLSINRLTQIAGRCRNGNLSEIIIFDIVEDKEIIDNMKSKDLI
jgi:hypothetical protein